MRPDYISRHPITDDIFADLYEPYHPNTAGYFIDQYMDTLGFFIDFPIHAHTPVDHDWCSIDEETLVLVLELGHWFRNDFPIDKFCHGPFSRNDASLDSYANCILNSRSVSNLRPEAFIPVILGLDGSGRKIVFLSEVPPDEATHLLFYHRTPRSQEQRQFYSEVVSYDCGPSGNFTLHEFGNLAHECERFYSVATETYVRTRLRGDEATFQRKISSTEFPLITSALQNNLIIA